MSPLAWPRTAVPLDAPPVLGIVLDGLGWGDDGTLWGGEFLLADYRGYQRLGTFKPVAMLGGAQAAREPWRNLYAHLMAEMGWAEFAMNFAELELLRRSCRASRARRSTRCSATASTRPGLVLRPAVRRGRGGARYLPRAAGL